MAKSIVITILTILLGGSVVYNFVLTEQNRKITLDNKALSHKSEVLLYKLKALKNNPKVEFEKAYAHYQLQEYQKAIDLCNQIISDYYDTAFIKNSKFLIAISKDSIEKQIYLKAKNAQTIDLIENYQELYPTGKYYSNLNRDLERIYVQKALKSLNVSDFDILIKKFPQSKFMGRYLEARNKVVEYDESLKYDQSENRNYSSATDNYVTTSYPSSNEVHTNYSSQPTYSTPKTYNHNISNYSPISYNTKTRTGAICKDGWRSSSTGRGTCSHHGGVDYWLYE